MLYFHFYFKKRIKQCYGLETKTSLFTHFTLILNYFQPDFLGLRSTKLWCVLETQRWPFSWQCVIVWAGKDHLADVNDAVLQLLSCTDERRHGSGITVILLFFFKNITFSFPSNSHVLCFEPQLNPAGKDSVSAISHSLRPWWNSHLEQNIWRGHSCLQLHWLPLCS